MLEAIPQFNPERPESERQWTARGGYEGVGESPALTVRQIRALAAGYALFQSMTLVGVWSIPFGSPDDAPWYQVAAGAGASLGALVAGGWYAVSALSGRHVNRRESGVMCLLLANPLWPAIAAIPSVFGWGDGNTVAIILLMLMGLCLVYGVPGGLIALSLRSRIGASDRDWSPHRTSAGGRATALVGVSMLVGGWAAALGLLAWGTVRALWFGLGGEDLRDVLPWLIWLMGAYVFGMGFGLLSSLFTATIPVPTRFDRSIPRLFVPAFVAGVGGSAFHPMVGFVGAGGVLIVMCFVVRRTCRLHPEGCCESCGYSMAGIDAAVCPECGREAGVGVASAQP